MNTIIPALIVLRVQGIIRSNTVMFFGSNHEKSTDKRAPLYRTENKLHSIEEVD